MLNKEDLAKIKAGKQCLAALIRAEQALRKYYLVQTKVDGAPERKDDSRLVLIDRMSEYSQHLHSKYDHLKY